MITKILLFMIIGAHPLPILAQTYINEVICDGLKFNVDICASSNLLANKLIDTFKVENIQKELAEISFSLIKINYIVIKQSPINILSSLFNNKEILGLSVNNANITTDWNWGTMFNQFPNLQNFRLENSVLPTNHMSIITEYSTKMLSFCLINCQIQSLRDDVFKKWPNLKMISIAKNRISTIYRDWFYSIMDNLWHLDFSYNKIETIPNDFFTKMPSLKFLRLDNNLFKTLKQEWFSNDVFYSLKEFWIFPNPIDCQADLCWIGNTTDNPLFFDDGECINPNIYFKIRNFYELRDEDIDICD